MSGADAAPDPGPVRGRGEERAEPAGRLTGDQRARLAAATPEDRERVLQDVRLQHLRHGLAGAVSEGRVSQEGADAVLDRLGRGDDAHELRRELRSSGVLARTPDRSRQENRDPENDRAGGDPPRWVRAFAIAGIVLLVLIVIMLLTGHGPGHHLQGLGQLPTTLRGVQSLLPVGDWP